MELRLDILKFSYFGVVHTIRISFSCDNGTELKKVVHTNQISCPRGRPRGFD